MKVVKNINELIKYLGFKPGTVIEFTGSQHLRDYELEIDFIPETKEELVAIIETASQENLQKMGICIWTSYELEEEDRKKNVSDLNHRDAVKLKPGEIHYLFPGEWYKHIPEGFEIIDIFGCRDKFKPGITDDDIRFGCLSFGFIRNF